MKKNKVMLLIPNLGMGGAENIVVNIAQYIDKNQFEIIVVSLYGETQCVDKYKEIIKDEKIKVIFMNKKNGIDVNVLWGLIKIVRKEKPDVIHTHLYSCIYGILPALLGKVQIKMHTVHNLAENELPGLYQKIMKIMYRFCGVIPVSINESVGESIKRRYGLPEKKIPLIKNGVEITRFSEAGVPQRKTEEKVLINVGRMSKQKNHRLLVECFSEIVQTYSNVRLLLVGDGELKGEIFNLAKRLKVDKKIDFVGNVKKVEEYLQKADIFIMTSDYEGLPLSVIEAMAAGLPIIATKAGGIKELVENEKNGYLSNVGDKESLVKYTLTLLQNPQECIRMGKNSKEMAQKYSVQNMVSKYETLYLGSGKKVVVNKKSF